jgi:hypothetical protein
MGCGWKRWKDEVGIERLEIVQAAWQETTTVFAKVMRGAVWCTQSKINADNLILETKFVDHGNSAVEDSCSVLVCVYKAHFPPYILPQPRRAILGGNQ